MSDTKRAPQAAKPKAKRAPRAKKEATEKGQATETMQTTHQDDGEMENENPTALEETGANLKGATGGALNDMGAVGSQGREDFDDGDRDDDDRDVDEDNDHDVRDERDDHRGGRTRQDDRSFNRRDGNGRDRAPEGPRVSYKPSDFYLTQVYFDRNLNQFIATVAEFPELRSQAGTKEQAYRDLERKIEGHIASLRNRNEVIPDAFHAKVYPAKLEVPISQTLFRRLDVLSRQEKESLETLVVELLTTAIERRGHSPQRHASQQQQHGRHDRDRDRDRDRQPQDRNRQSQDRNRHRGQQQQRRTQGRGYHENLENKENFLEYVRNLEKSGGGGSNWRKK